MKVMYFATLRDITGKLEEDWTLPAATLRDLMGGLIARYGSRFEKWVVKGGELSGLAVILVNGKDARHSGGLDTPLSPDSEIFMFPPVAGGSQG
jgi:MoaD family protein